jgi:methionyl-tRNA synthetase
VNNKFYITTTLPYVNAEPHIGFAWEIIQADVIARWAKLSGKEVVFNFGTDEHGLKIYRKALEQKKDPLAYCDEYAAKFDDLKKALNLSYTNFIRTTDKHHIQATQEFWKRCAENGDIYKKAYKTKYCVGCELEKTDSELKDGKCPIHPTQNLEVIEEENYFFRFSKFQKQLLDFYEKNPDFVIPESKFNEIKSFVNAGLEDFSVSRLKAKMPWGIDVPGDPEHIMYVWFDALINYISTLGWPDDTKKFEEFWPGVQVAGKDNLRQQTAIWQAMLLSAGLPNSKQVFIHGFLTLNGQKISKSQGNTIDPIELVTKYGTDAVRYYLLAKVQPFEDGDFSISKFEDGYNADLANGLGNLVARVAKLAEKTNEKWKLDNIQFNAEISQKLDIYRFDEAIKIIWEKISGLDRKIEEIKPWKLEGDNLAHVLKPLVAEILDIAINLLPFLPETAEKILKQFQGPAIKSEAPLFPRISK